MIRRRFLITVFSEAGKLNPMLAVAKKLESDGHNVTLYCLQADVTTRAAAAGVRAPVITGDGGETFEPPADHRSASFTVRMRKPKWAANWLRGSLLQTAPRHVDGVGAALESQRPDVVVVPPMGYGAAIAALRHSVPWAAVSTGFMGLIPDGDRGLASTTFSHLAEPRRALFARYGVDASFRVSDVISPWLNIIFADPTLCPPALSGNRHAYLVGPCANASGRGDERDFAWSRLPDDRPTVLVSFGGHLSPKEGTYEALSEALHPDEAFMVLVTREPMQLPDHVMQSTWVPQVALLPRTSVMVNHGGSNSVMECLHARRPMLMVPILHDQHALADYVVRAGAGVQLDYDGVTPARCRELLLPLLASDSPWRRRAETLAAGFTDGAERACQLLVQLAVGDALPGPEAVTGSPPS